MFKILKRKPKPYVAERDRLQERLASLDPASDEYQTVLHRMNELDKILNRSSDKFKTVVSTAGPVVAIGGIYALQQFGGVLVPKVAETYAARQESKKNPRELD
jgi:hypothetical protein